MAIKQTDIKKLFSRSAGQCNICKLDVAEGDVVIGQMAHMIAKSPRGPRGNENTHRNDLYDNLILLCPNHHIEVDSRPSAYPEHRLREIKSKHEADIAARLNRSQEYEQDLNSLNTLFKFIPFLRLGSLAMELPDKLSSDFEISETFNNFRKSNPQAYPFRDKELTRLWGSFISDADEIKKFTLSNVHGDKLYPFGEPRDKDGYHNVYVGDDNGRFIVMNKRFLQGKQRGLVEDTAHQLVQTFIYSHKELVDYILDHFKDIKW